MTWGFEIIIDLSGCNPRKLKDVGGIQAWLGRLIPAIDMKAYGSLQIEHFATHSHDAAGYSFLQFIETSSITGHLAENLGQAYINLFSCKVFDPEFVLKSAIEHFEATSFQKVFIERGNQNHFSKIVHPVFKDGDTIRELIGEMGRVA